MYERRCTRSLEESRDWLRGSRLHVLIECVRERERERERGGERERESPPPHLRTRLIGPEDLRRGKLFRLSPRIFFTNSYILYNFLIYRYVHCYVYICTFCTTKVLLFFMIGYLCSNEGVIYVNFQFLHYF